MIASRRRTTRVVCAKDISTFNYGTHLINESYVSKFDDAMVFFNAMVLKTIQNLSSKYNLRDTEYAANVSL